MKILHIGKYYPPFRGGMETALQNISEGLLDAGHEVTVISAGETSREEQELIIGPKSGREGRLIRAAVKGVVFSQPVTAGLVGLLRREIKLMAPDVVQLHLPNPLAAAAWLALAGLNSARVPAFTVWYHADITRQKVGRLLVKPLLFACLNRAVGVAVAAKALRDRSPILKRFRDQVSVIPFGVAVEPWLSVEARRDGPFLFVGRLVPYKGVDVLLRAMTMDTKTELVVVGDGPLLGELSELTRELGLSDRVNFTGPLNQEGIAAHLAAARGLVLPSVDESEAFGLVQLEAMAAAVPVIASDLPTGVPEVGIDGETGILVHPGDHHSLANALQTLQEDAGLRKKMGCAGRRRFLANFSRSQMIEGLVAFYEAARAKKSNEVVVS